jgi:hypothetical protein
MNLVVCPNRMFAVYLLAYIKQFGEGERFHIAISGSGKVPRELIAVAETLNTTFINEKEIGNHEYHDLVLHSYAKIPHQLDFISSIKFQRIRFYADALSNGLYGLPRLDNRLEGIIFFGFVLNDEAFASLQPPLKPNLNRRIVSLKFLQLIWGQLLLESGLTISTKFQAGDLVLAERYWDYDRDHYSFGKGRTLFEYLKKEFLNISGFDRIVLRRHPWYSDPTKRYDIELYKEIFGCGIEIVLWEDLFLSNPDFPELLEPESIFWNCDTSPKGFFGFDSSLCVLLGQKHRSTEIIWPRRENYEEFFERKLSVDIVSEKVQWMLELSKLEIIDGPDPSEVHINGSGLERAISIKFLDSASHAITLRQKSELLERDALTQERDALTQERDGLVAERDGLVAERDGLINSRIWRATRFVRVIVSFLKRIRLQRPH